MYENSPRAALWATHDLYFQHFSPSSISLESMFLLVTDCCSTGFYRKWGLCYISNKGQYLLAEYERVWVCMENGVMSHQKERSGWRVLEWASMTLWLVPSAWANTHECIWIVASSQVQDCQSLSQIHTKNWLANITENLTKLDKIELHCATNDHTSMSA